MYLYYFVAMVRSVWVYMPLFLKTKNIVEFMDWL